jgi:hypothetical protein
MIPVGGERTLMQQVVDEIEHKRSLRLSAEAKRHKDFLQTVDLGRVQNMLQGRLKQLLLKDCVSRLGLCENAKRAFGYDTKAEILDDGDLFRVDARCSLCGLSVSATVSRELVATMKYNDFDLIPSRIRDGKA